MSTLKAVFKMSPDEFKLVEIILKDYYLSLISYGTSDFCEGKPCEHQIIHLLDAEVGRFTSLLDGQARFLFETIFAKGLCHKSRSICNMSLFLVAHCFRSPWLSVIILLLLLCFFFLSSRNLATSHCERKDTCGRKLSQLYELSEESTVFQLSSHKGFISQIFRISLWNPTDGLINRLRPIKPRV